MNINEIRQIIKDRFQANNKDGYHLLDYTKTKIIDLDSPRSTRILGHYAAQPQMGATVIEQAIFDLRGMNKKPVGE